MKTPTTLIVLLASALTSTAGPGRGCPPEGFTLHEWGTFTTLSASNGTLLPGVQREEEPLPEFVESHEGMFHHASWRAVKGWMRPLANVTVRMETPVIYFYTKEAFDARVEVGFRGGSISQWYPTRTGGETPPTVVKNPQGIRLEKENTIDFAKGYNGSIRWDVTVTPAGEDAAGRVFKPGETPSWIYPRHPDSALVTTKNGQCENFLFYRGLGNFTLPVTFSSSGSGRVTIKNTGADDVSGLLIYELNDYSEGRWSTCDTVKAGATVEIDLTGKNPSREQWRAGVYADTVAMLARAGLNRKEADAMAQTWWPSYFERAGLRVFWIVPRKFTDHILPLNVTPAPKETVRVLVGRSEVMTPEFEQRLASDFESERGAERWSNDRYFPAYQYRVEQLSKGTAKVK
jgi:hypothetical protein